MNSIYDGATAYSLRDRDESPGDLEDMQPVVRMRLACRAAENLLLCDDVLESTGINWKTASKRIDTWVNDQVNGSHAKYQYMKAFVDGGKKRKEENLKEIRMILIDQILESNKPWEVVVGQAIGELAKGSKRQRSSLHSISSYLGSKVLDNIVSKPS